MPRSLGVALSIWVCGDGYDDYHRRRLLLIEDVRLHRIKPGMRCPIFSQISIYLFCADGKPMTERPDAGICVWNRVFAHLRHIYKVSAIPDKRTWLAMKSELAMSSVFFRPLAGGIRQVTASLLFCSLKYPVRVEVNLL